MVFLTSSNMNLSCVDLAVKHQLSRPRDKTGLECEIKIFFLVSHQKPYVMGTQKNRLNETVL